jgi:hypothetical protein
MAGAPLRPRAASASRNQDFLLGKIQAVWTQRFRPLATSKRPPTWSKLPTHTRWPRVHFQTRLDFRRTGSSAKTLVLSETFSFEACVTVAPALRPSSAAISAGGSFPAKLLSLALSASVHDRKLGLGICELLQNTASSKAQIGKTRKSSEAAGTSGNAWRLWRCADGHRHARCLDGPVRNLGGGRTVLLSGSIGHALGSWHLKPTSSSLRIIK